MNDFFVSAARESHRKLMPKLTILPLDKEIIIEKGSNLRRSLMDNGISVKSTCGGHASCGDCVVVVKKGEGNLSEITFEEKQILGNVYHLTSERLSCQTNILTDESQDIIVDVSMHIEKKIPVKTHRRTREEADKIVSDRHSKSKEKPRKQGGRKRPKAF